MPDKSLAFNPEIPHVLPHEKMYKLQIGNKLFLLSGASLSSDAPSYFTKYFQKTTPNISADPPTTRVNDPPILFIDRDPEIFQKIYNHLQGYFIDIKDEVEYTKLFADAMYYNLPRLKNLLKNSNNYYTNIGGKHYVLNKQLFTKNKGNSPNYFTITSEIVYMDLENFFMQRNASKNAQKSPWENEIVLENAPLLRPPPQSPPMVNRSPELFDKLLIILNKGEIDFQMSYTERCNLIKECRFYRFQHLEQMLIKHAKINNPFIHKLEIVMNLLDVKLSGISSLNFSASSPDTQVDTLVGNNKQETIQLPKSYSEISSFSSDLTTNNHYPETNDRNSDSNSSSSICSSTPSTPHATTDETMHADKKRKLCAPGPTAHLKKCLQEKWASPSYKRPFVDEQYRKLIFQVGNSIALNGYDSCSYPQPSKSSSATSSRGTPVPMEAESQCTDCYNPYGSLFFDKKNKRMYIEFPMAQSSTTDTLAKIVDKVTNGKLGIKQKYAYMDMETQQEVLLLPCCTVVANLQINGKKISNLKHIILDPKCAGVFTEGNMIKSSDLALAENNYLNGSEALENYKMKGYRLHLCDASIWRLGFKTQDDLMMIAAKLNCCTNLKEYNDLTFS
ncbi:hypothetical protein ACO0RG_002539 [Hanseniaspora osmophila]